MPDIYNIDMLKAEVFGVYLDKNFYNKVGNDFSIVRSTNINEQKRGIDLRLSSKKLKLNNVLVDEKCSFYYINGKLDTFSLELSRISGAGWFLSDYCETEYYLIAWPYGDKDFGKHIENLFGSKEPNTDFNDFVKHCREKGKLPYNEITGAEIMLISKTDIIDGLGEVLGQDRKAVLEFLKRKSLEMREIDYRQDKTSSSEIHLGDGIKIKKSFCWWKGSSCEKCYELNRCKGRNRHIKKTEPINLIINKRLLGNWATYKTVVGHQATGEDITVAWRTSQNAYKIRKRSPKPKRRLYLELYNKGLSIEEIAIRNEVKEITVYENLVKCVEDGQLDYHLFTNDHRINMIQDYLTTKDCSSLKSVKDEAPFEIDYWEIKLALHLRD